MSIRRKTIKNIELLLIVVLACFHFNLMSQEVISSQGESYLNNGIELDFTLGEPVVESMTNQTIEIYQGFHQPSIRILDVTDYSSPIKISAFPNPTQELVHIKLDCAENLTYLIYDEQGKLLQEKTNHAIETTLNLETFNSGIYNLIIQQQGEVISTIKIFKSN